MKMKKISSFLVLFLILISSSSGVSVVLLSPRHRREEVPRVEGARTAGTIKNKHCCGSASEIQSVSAFRQKARKLLPVIPKDSSVSLKQAGVGGRVGRGLEEEGNYHADASIGTRKVAVATLPASLLLCCALLCRCFWSKKKEPSEQPVLELTTKDYASSSFDQSSNSDRTLSGRQRLSSNPLRASASTPKFSMSPQLNRAELVHLDMNQIIKATQKFSHSHEIGQGGFGTVYKAELPDGQVVAIKRARKEHFQASKAEFSSEVELLANIEHRNLVRLLGYVDNGNERIIISEYIPNGTLREHLDGQRGTILDFNQRLEIAIDVAHALTYLHLYAEKPIIHRDVKSSNILLTESFKAKVSDFGFARVGATTEDQSHVLTKVRGTAGYLDPEYLRTHQLTPKSDVFSFGILLIEIMSGRHPVESKRNFDERVTIRWAFKKYTQGRMRDIMDPLLEEHVPGEVPRRMFGLAFECAAPTRTDRPTMKQVVETLWEIRKEYSRNLRRE